MNKSQIQQLRDVFSWTPEIWQHLTCGQRVSVGLHSIVIISDTLACKIQCTSTLQVFWNGHRTSIYTGFLMRNHWYLQVFYTIYVICIADLLIRLYPLNAILIGESRFCLLLDCYLVVQLFYHYAVVLLAFAYFGLFYNYICKN